MDGAVHKLKQAVRIHFVDPHAAFTAFDIDSSGALDWWEVARAFQTMGVRENRRTIKRLCEKVGDEKAELDFEAMMKLLDMKATDKFTDRLELDDKSE